MEQVFGHHPSIQQIVFVENKACRQSQITKLFQKASQPCFEVSQLKRNQSLMKDYLYTSLIKQLQKWNKKVINQQHDVDSRRQLTRNTFLYTELKRILVYQQTQQKEQIVKLYNWFQSNAQNRAKTAHAPRVHRHDDVDDSWHVRKKFKHNMQSELKNYRRRTLAQPENDSLMQIKRFKTEQNEKALNQHRYFRQKIKDFHSRVQKQRQCKEISWFQNRFSYDRCRYNENRYKDYLKGTFRQDDVWKNNNNKSNTYQHKLYYKKKIQILAKENKQNQQSKENMNNSHQADNIKRHRIAQALSQNNLHIFKGIRATEYLDCPTSIDGAHLLKNPFQVALKKKKKRKL